MIKIKPQEMDAQALVEFNHSLYAAVSHQFVLTMVQSFAETEELEEVKLVMMEIPNLVMDVQMFVQSKLDSTVQVNHQFVLDLLFQTTQIILEIHLGDYLWSDLPTLI
jgi:hypothetical protein